MYLFRLIFFTFLIFSSFILKASVLDEVKKRGYLKCGVSEPTIQKQGNQRIIIE